MAYFDNPENMQWWQEELAELRIERQRRQAVHSGADKTEAHMEMENALEAEYDMEMENAPEAEYDMETENAPEAEYDMEMENAAEAEYETGMENSTEIVTNREITELPLREPISYEELEREAGMASHGAGKSAGKEPQKQREVVM